MKLEATRFTQAMWKIGGLSKSKPYAALHFGRAENQLKFELAFSFEFT